MQQKQKHELEDKPGNFKQLLEKLKTKLKKTHKNLKTLEEWWFKKIDGYGPWTSDQ